MPSTREKIIKACEELAVKRGRGFYNLSLDELAQEAGVSKRTIYRYFTNKEEIIAAAIDMITDMIAQKNFALLDSDQDFRQIAVALLKNASYLVNPQILQDLRIYYPLLWEKIDNIRKAKVDLLVTKILENRSVKMRWRVDPQIFRDSFLAAMSTVLTPGYIMDSGKSFEEVGVNFLEMFLFGAVEVSANGRAPAKEGTPAKED